MKNISNFRDAFTRSDAYSQLSTSTSDFCVVVVCLCCAFAVSTPPAGWVNGRRAANVCVCCAVDVVVSCFTSLSPHIQIQPTQVLSAAPQSSKQEWAESNLFRGRRTNCAWNLPTRREGSWLKICVPWRFRGLCSVVFGRIEEEFRAKGFQQNLVGLQRSL